MIKVAIAGFGQVGKELYSIIKKRNNFSLKYVFSNRKIELDVPVVDYETALSLTDEIDVVIFATSSHNQTEELLLKFIPLVCTVDCFDNTEKLLDLKNKLHPICKQNKKCAILGCGWDPGFFDIVRNMFSVFDDVEIKSSWGKGMSCGHSNAIRNVEDVIDAIEFTEPCKNGHLRRCFVCTKYPKVVTERIKKIPHYFENHPIKLTFCSAQKIQKLRQNLSHKGEVSFNTPTSNGKIVFQMENNPKFTAEILLAYARLAKHYCTRKKYGAFFPSNLPTSDL